MTYTWIELAIKKRGGFGKGADSGCWLGGREGCFGKGFGSGCWLGGQAWVAGRVLPPRPTLARFVVVPKRSIDVKMLSLSMY